MKSETSRFVDVHQDNSSVSLCMSYARTRGVRINLVYERTSNYPIPLWNSSNTEEDSINPFSLWNSSTPDKLVQVESAKDT